MKRLYLTVEGQTEQAFAVAVLGPHLSAFDVFVEKPALTGPHGRQRGRIPRGGLLHTFAHALADMRRWLRENRSSEARFSMMVDLYALPHDVPGHAAARRKLGDPCAQAEMLEAALADEIKDQRFIPYIQVHEFEALLLAGPEKFTEHFGREKQSAMLLAECNRFPSPELINHGQHTHPKAIIKKYFADYGERVDGPLLAQAIGLPQIRQKCPHFDRWLTRLENLDRGGT